MAKYEITIEAESEHAVFLAAQRLFHAFSMHEKDEAPFSLTINHDETPEADHDLSGPDGEGWFGPDPTLDYDDWVTHDGSDCPVHSLDMVEVMFENGNLRGPATPDKFHWSHGVAYPNIKKYRHWRDEDGTAYIYDDGTLEPWAEYVATGRDGRVKQFNVRPTANFTWGIVVQGRSRVALDHYANTTDHWTQTLRRVWRP